MVLLGDYQSDISQKNAGLLAEFSGSGKWFSVQDRLTQHDKILSYQYAEVLKNSGFVTSMVYLLSMNNVKLSPDYKELGLGFDGILRVILGCQRGSTVFIGGSEVDLLKILNQSYKEMSQSLAKHSGGVEISDCEIIQFSYFQTPEYFLNSANADRDLYNNKNAKVLFWINQTRLFMASYVDLTKMVGKLMGYLQALDTQFLPKTDNRTSNLKLDAYEIYVIEI